MPREPRKGDTVEVVDVDLPKTAKGKLPFAKGAQFEVSRVSPSGRSVALKGLHGWWLAHRFEVRARG
jgi:hypothetical protein